MASVHGLCVMGMHLKTIWGVAKQVLLSMMPFNPVVRIEESPFVNPAGDEVGVQIELYTIHGWELLDQSPSRHTSIPTLTNHLPSFLDSLATSNHPSTNHRVRSVNRELSDRSPNKFALPPLTTQNPNSPHS